MTEKLRVYSMFSGIGGIDLGLEATGGFETVLFSEIEPFACKLLEKRWPDVPNVGDCTTVGYALDPYDDRFASFDQRESEEMYGTWHRPDVIAAGFPCQSISAAGKQEGIKDGTESGLWFEVVRACRELRPRYLFLENVSAITRSNDGADFERVLRDLADLGYDATWSVLRASDFGFPHTRARWFAIAYLRGEREQVQDPRQLAAVQESWWTSTPDGTGGRFEWAAEPYVGGSDDGLPAWVDGSGQRLVAYSEQPKRGRWDRIRGLGNAVVPAQAQHVGEGLLRLHRALTA